jgi:DNA-binding response OmpR family regulator
MNRKVLIVDDEEAIRFVLRRALSEQGWSVDEVEDGAEVEDSLEKKRYDLVILDLYMPGMNGFEVLRLLRRGGSLPQPSWKTPKDVKVLVVSGAAGEEGLDFACRIGADANLRKPFELSEVRRIVKALAGR